MSSNSETADSCGVVVANAGHADSLANKLDEQVTLSDTKIEVKTTQDGVSFEQSMNDANSDNHGSDGSEADTEQPRDVAVPIEIPSANVSATPNDEFICPDEELIAKIVTQIEFYFSDENIVNDTYLLKHIKRNKQGFVSIKVISTFKKTKKLSKDHRVIAYALRRSQKLQVNEPGTKVRRIDPLPQPPADPQIDAPLRTVVATNLSMENPTMETIVEKFAKCGNIAQVRIIRPGSSVPADAKKHLEKHLEVGANSAFALVEYEDAGGAVKACKTLTNTGDWRRGMRVTMLVPPAKKESAGTKNTESKQGSDERAQESDGAESNEAKKYKKKKKRNSRVMELAQGESPYSSSSSDVDRRKSPSRDNTSRASPVQGLKPGDTSKAKKSGTSPKSSPKGSPTAARRSGNHYGRSPLAHDSENEDWRARSSSFGASAEILGTSPSQGQSPWVQRRLKAQQDAGVSPGASPLLGRRSGDIAGAVPPEAGDFHRASENDRVVRQPRGPDGSKGFRAGRTEVLVVN